MSIPNQSPERLAEIAADIHKGLIFTDRHCPTPNDVCNVFMILLLMEKKDFEELKVNPPGLIYEYYAKAMPRSINGLPCFFSCHFLNQADTDKVVHLVTLHEEADRVIAQEVAKIGVGKQGQEEKQEGG